MKYMNKLLLLYTHIFPPNTPAIHQTHHLTDYLLQTEPISDVSMF